MIFKKLSTLRQKITLKKKSYEDLSNYFRNPPKQTVDGLNVSPERYARPELLNRSEFLHDFIKDYIDISEHVLELGCGVCRNLNYLSKKGYKHIHGIDINEEAISLSTKLYPRLKERKENLKINSLEEGLKEYRDREFGLVFTMCTLMHIHPDVEKKVFEEIYRISKKVLITLEYENSLHNTHFPRNYGKIFKKLGFEEKTLIKSDEKLKKIFGDITIRLFVKKK